MDAGRILFVDDDPALADIARRALHHHGFSVLSATTGEGALALMRTEELDAVITDLRMPEMDGLQLVERSSAPTSRSSWSPRSAAWTRRWRRYARVRTTS